MIIYGQIPVDPSIIAWIKQFEREFVLQMRNIPIIVLVFCSLLGIYSLARGEDVSTSSSSIISTEIEGITDQILNENIDNSIFQSYLVRREYIIPVLEKIYSKPVKCQDVRDDDQAFEEFKKIIENREQPESFLPFFNDDFYERLHTTNSITPELERKIQEGSGGHVTFVYPNGPAIEALAQINYKYPCSEAAALALIYVGNAIIQPGYLYVVPIAEKKYILAFEESYLLNQYIKLTITLIAGRER